MDVDDSGIEKGGSGLPDIGTYLVVSGAIITSIRVRDMGPDTDYAEGFGQILS